MRRLPFSPMRRMAVTCLALFSAMGSRAIPQEKNPIPPTASPPGASVAYGGLPAIRISENKQFFVRGNPEHRFEIRGANYDRDDQGRLLEDYWEKEWSTVESDFQEMSALGLNAVRIHLQTCQFMTGPDTFHAENLTRLGRLLDLGEREQLYVNLTGLGCYLKDRVPMWYSSLDENSRWTVQEKFWSAIARVARGRNAVFCYDLMNEPLVSGGEDPQDWLPGKPLEGKHYVQRITTKAAGRTETAIAAEWVRRLCAAIRREDPRTPITVGVIPWAQVFPGAKPLFYAPEVHGPLDFVSVHLYPRSGKLPEDLAALEAYNIGKPLVIEEIFPLSASIPETVDFLRLASHGTDGWFTFYWGATIPENARKGTTGGALVVEWLQAVRKLTGKNQTN
ncbi:MAG: hypothetical protein JWL81_1444 [Verrucomicrobiales bacterium]|nr:hypothetical protein [Verrucomicrobiales bacterium]